MGFSLKQYNKQQQEIIKHDSGPLLVVSGAGTGKTHVLTGRILYLLLEKGIKPEEILALTFTEKAAQEMVQRVSNALPLGFDEIWIKTFHGFADSILREKGFEIGLAIDYKLMSEADSWMFLKHHLMDFEFDYFRPLGNPLKFLKSMQDYFSRLQDEDITPERYIDYAEKLGKNAGSEEEKENAGKHLELAKAYKKHLELLIKESCLNFGGLLFFTLRLLEKRLSALAELQKRFKYILVDEFQDTNFAQNKIVTMLSRASGNLMVVGDDDQSIYKWRGASLTNIQYFKKLFPQAKNVVLNRNYRSNQAILDSAYSVIQNNNPNRLEIAEKVDKKLVSAVHKKIVNPQIFHFGESDEEADFVIAKAAALQSKGQDAAILARTNALGALFANRLRQANISFQHFAAADFFSKKSVKDILSVLKAVSNPWDSMALYRCLTLPVWEIPMVKILEAFKKSRYENVSMFELLNSGDFAKVKALFKDLIEYSREEAVSGVLRKFFAETGYLQKTQPAGLDDVVLLSEKVRDFEQISQSKTVTDFLDYMKMLEESGEKDPAGDFLDPSLIKILTIHAAKGLEFDAVFIPGLVQGKFPSISRREPLQMPDALIDELLPPGNLHLEEERRLFYVACTRAKENLFVTYSDYYDSAKQWKPSPFISEMAQSGKTIVKQGKQKGRADNKKQASLPFLEQKPAPPVRFEIPKLSFSQLDMFNTCPLKYKYRYLMNIPIPTPAVMNFGSSLHNTLKDFYLYLQKNPKKTSEDNLPLLIKFYEKNWIPYGYDSKAVLDDQKRRGRILLEKYYKKEKNNLKPPAFVEVAFHLRIGDVVLFGRIDRIDKLKDGSYEVIDYKSGSTKDKNPKKDLQLSIYALACRDFLKIPVSRLSLYYLEDLQKISTQRTEQELAAAEDEIKAKAREILQSDFAPSPGYHCGFCDYRLICPAAGGTH